MKSMVRRDSHIRLSVFKRE